MIFILQRMILHIPIGQEKATGMQPHIIASRFFELRCRQLAANKNRLAIHLNDQVKLTSLFTLAITHGSGWIYNSQSRHARHQNFPYFASPTKVAKIVRSPPFSTMDLHDVLPLPIHLHVTHGKNWDKIFQQEEG